MDTDPLFRTTEPPPAANTTATTSESTSLTDMFSLIVRGAAGAELGRWKPPDSEGQAYYGPRRLPARTKTSPREAAVFVRTSALEPLPSPIAPGGASPEERAQRAAATVVPVDDLPPSPAPKQGGRRLAGVIAGTLLLLVAAVWFVGARGGAPSPLESGERPAAAVSAATPERSAVPGEGAATSVASAPEPPVVSAEPGNGHSTAEAQPSAPAAGASALRAAKRLRVSPAPAPVPPRGTARAAEPEVPPLPSSYEENAK